MADRPIQVLTDEVIGQIAAGEVVERPAAAVKELVENSIDAGATAVTVELKDGGITSIRISDNGRGIPASQVRMAFARHATSKLTTAEELYDVHTLGFRGEALASIAAVSKITCVTRTADAEYGVQAKVEAGQFVSVHEAAGPTGTTLTVHDLFFNAPVRLKFLKKPATEAAYVSDYMMRLILSHPDVAFRFVNQGKTVYRSAGDGTLESAVYCVYGREALVEMRRVSGAQNGVLLEGYVGVGELSRGNRMQQSFFINGRYFRDEGISRALESGCEGFVMIGRYPICVLFMTLPYRQVDVNVHPNKLEVRFQRPAEVNAAVETLVRQALAGETIQSRLAGERSAAQAPQAPEIHLTELSGDETTTDEPLTGEPALPPSLREAGGYTAGNAEALLAMPRNVWLTEAMEEDGEEAVTEELTSVRPEAIDFAPETPIVLEDLAGTEMAFSLPETKTASEPEGEQQRLAADAETIRLSYIGAAFKTFLIFEAGERLLLVDQHAAHERILYDRFMARYTGTNVSQPLLAPQAVRLTAQEVALLSDMREALSDAGFDIEPFDATTVAVRAIPVILGRNEPVRELLTDVLEEARAGRDRFNRDRIRGHIAQMACKHAVKGGDVLSAEDVRALLAQMLENGTQPTCPHGRPIVSVLTRRELEKRFKRIP